jgi:hypothetical protein
LRIAITPLGDWLLAQDLMRAVGTEPNPVDQRLSGVAGTQLGSGCVEYVLL